MNVRAVSGLRRPGQDETFRTFPAHNKRPHGGSSGTLCEMRCPEWWDTSNQLIEIAGSVNDTVNFNGVSADDVEDKVRFHKQDPIAVLPEFWMPGNASQKWVVFKLADPFIQLVDKGYCSGWAILCDELQNGKKVVLSNGKIAKRGFNGHEPDDGVLSSSVDV